MPGESTSWHLHGVPVAAYILEGAVEVDYGTKGRRTFRKGEAFNEAIHWPHRGNNPGDTPVSILVVYVTAAGVSTSRPAERR